MSGDLSGITYRGPGSISYTSIEEARQGQGAEGQAAPAGTTPVPVGDGECISLLMARAGLDWNAPGDRLQFLQDNPQFIGDRDLAEFGDALAPFLDQAGGRDPDLVYAGEVLYIRTPGADGTPAAGGVDQTGDNGAPPTAEQAADATDQAAQAVEDAQDATYPPGLEHERQQAVQEARQTFFDAVEAEIDAGLQAYIAQNPEATPQQIEAEADRLGHQIQGRTSYAASVDDTSMAYRTQQAIDSATAAQHGINLAAFGPGAVTRDGPYTEASGPFEPNASVQLTDGHYVRTDENGWPQTDADHDGVPDPWTPEAAAESTNEAASALQDARDMEVPGGLQFEKDEAISFATQRVGDAMQREIELGLQAYIAANPEAAESEIAAEADRLMHGILGREEVGGVISEHQADFRREQALTFVTTGE